MWAEDPEDPCADQLGFTWETKYFTEIEWVIQLFLDKPSCVSASTKTGDTLSITLYDQSLFVDTRGKRISPEFKMERKVVRQIEAGD